MRSIAVSFTFTDEDFNRIKEAVTVREHALAYHEAEADKADGWRP